MTQINVEVAQETIDALKAQLDDIQDELELALQDNVALKVQIQTLIKNPDDI